jgi:peptidoglycan/LPS O-acetylase OafA/YrhL
MDTRMSYRQADAPALRPSARLGDAKQGLSAMPYLPGLDGLRAVAVVAVMIYHANHDWLKGGFLGVEVFFVISGYLITLLLIGEHERTGGVDLKQFWIRRFRRLLPALFVMMALLMLYLAVGFRDAQGSARGDLVAGAAYISNWFQISSGAGYTQAEAFAPLRHLWSLAVEEQFYVVWPLIMVAILRRAHRNLPKVALWLVGVSLAITVVVWALFVGGDINSTCADDPRGYWSIAGRCISINDTLYLSTITRAGGLMLGAAMAMLWRPNAIMRGPLRDRTAMLDGLGAAGLMILLLMFARVGLSSPALTSLTGIRFDANLFQGGLLLAGVATVFLIMAITHNGTLIARGLDNPLFLWIGTRSYGLYLYHWPIYQIIRKQAGLSLSVVEFVLAMIITAALTEASFQFIETPIRQGALNGLLSRRSGRARLSGSTMSALAIGLTVTLVSCASIARAPIKCLGEVGRTLCAADVAQANDPSATGSDTPAADGSTASTPPQSAEADTAGSSAPTTEPAPTSTSTIPVEQRLPIAIGESVMKGAVPQLQAGGFAVYAEENKGPNWARETLAGLRTQNLIGNIVVIQVGTNGAVTTEQYDAIMAELVGVPTVVFLTVKAPRDWIAPNNAEIRALPGRYPNVQILEWEANAATIEGELSTSDGGIHLRTEKAQQFYANYIFGVLGMDGKIVDLNTL